MVFGAATAVGATADEVDLGRPPARRMSSSADGPLRNGHRRGRGREGVSASSSAAAVPETVVLVLGNFQGVVVLDMGVVMVSFVLLLENAERGALPKMFTLVCCIVPAGDTGLQLLCRNV